MGPALGTPDQWIGVGLSASPWDLAVVYRLGQAEIGLSRRDHPDLSCLAWPPLLFLRFTWHNGFQLKRVEWGAVSQDLPLMSHQGDVGWVGQPAL